MQSKIGLPDGTYDLKIGKSFSKSSKNRQDFHTLRYDFKPKSVASDQEAYMAMGSNDDVHIAFPNDTGDNLTMYKGASKSLKDGKECLLIFDEDSQEMRLEKVVSNLNVKQTRGVDEEIEQALRRHIQKVRGDKSKKPTNSGAPLNKQSHSTDQLFAEMSSSDDSSSSEDGEIVENSLPPKNELSNQVKKKYSFDLEDSDKESTHSFSSCDEAAAALERKLKGSSSPATTTNEDESMDMPDLFALSQQNSSQKPLPNQDRHRFTMRNVHNNLANDLDLSESDEDTN